MDTIALFLILLGIVLALAGTFAFSGSSNPRTLNVLNREFNVDRCVLALGFCGLTLGFVGLSLLATNPVAKVAFAGVALLVLAAASSKKSPIRGR